MEPKYTIYCHTHIESGRRYIGLTKYTMMHRWNQHCAQAMRSNGGRWHFPNAIRKYGKDAFSHEVLEVCNVLEEANTREDHWIEHFKTRDPQFGFNLAKGGEHKPHPIRKNPWDNPEFRAKQLARPNPFHSPQARANNKAALNTPESRAKRSAASKEVRSRPDVNRKIAEAFAGYKPSQETREKIGMKSKGRRPGATTRAKLSEAYKRRSEESKAKCVGWGRKCSEQTRAKLSKALKGRPMSQETRKKLSAANKGKFSEKQRIAVNKRDETWSPERRRKMSDSLKRYWAERKSGA